MTETYEIIIEFSFSNERLSIHSEAHQWCIYIYIYFEYFNNYQINAIDLNVSLYLKNTFLIL